mgnify:CR=1 FL=1
MTELKLTVEPKIKALLLYENKNGGYTLGTTKIKIRLGEVEIETEAHVVPNEFQEEDLLIGRNVLEKSEVITVISEGKWYFFPNNNKTQEASKIPVLANQTLTIKSLSVKYCKISQRNEVENETIFVESGTRGKQIFIPDCVTALSGYIPIINYSKKPLLIKKIR